MLCLKHCTMLSCLHEHCCVIKLFFYYYPMSSIWYLSTFHFHPLCATLSFCNKSWKQSSFKPFSSLLLFLINSLKLYNSPSTLRLSENNATVFSPPNVSVSPFNPFTKIFITTLFSSSIKTHKINAFLIFLLFLYYTFLQPVIEQYKSVFFWVAAREICLLCVAEKNFKQGPRGITNYTIHTLHRTPFS